MGETGWRRGRKSEKRQHLKKICVCVSDEGRHVAAWMSSENCMCVWVPLRCVYVCSRVLTLSAWGWKEPGRWLTHTARRTELAGQPGCSWGPSRGHESEGAAADGSEDGVAAVVGAEVGVGAGAEAGVWAAAGSYRVAHCEKASVGRSGSDNQPGPFSTCSVQLWVCVRRVNWSDVDVCVSARPCVFDVWLFNLNGRMWSPGVSFLAAGQISAAVSLGPTAFISLTLKCH